MQQQITSYADATFPFDTFAGSGTKARLLAVVGDRVVGCTYYDRADGSVSCNMAFAWHFDGRYSDGQSYPTLDLLPPPGKVAEITAQLEAEIATIEQRLADNPEAPEAWTAGDNAMIRQLRARIEKMQPPKPVVVEPPAPPAPPMGRREFEMTVAQRDAMLAAGKPVPAMALSGGAPMFDSPQANANKAWEALGRELGFVWDTVQPVNGKSDLFFTAIPTPAAADA